MNPKHTTDLHNLARQTRSRIYLVLLDTQKGLATWKDRLDPPQLEEFARDGWQRCQGFRAEMAHVPFDEIHGPLFELLEEVEGEARELIDQAAERQRALDALSPEHGSHK